MNYFPRQSTVELSLNRNCDCPVCSALRWTHYMFTVSYKHPLTAEYCRADVLRCCGCGSLITVEANGDGLLACTPDRACRKWLQTADHVRFAPKSGL